MCGIFTFIWKIGVNKMIEIWKMYVGMEKMIRVFKRIG